MPLDVSHDIIARHDPDPRYASLLREIGGTMLAENDVQFVDLKDLPKADGRKPVVLTNGACPGIARGPAAPGRGDETASASREPWVDADGYWIGYLRALYPQRPALLGYVPTAERMVPFDTLELALIDAWAAGGNYVLSPEPSFRQALLRGDARALEAWRELGRTARWLQQNAALFRQPAMPIITQLVEGGEATAEIANLLYRRNASPALERADSPPAPDPQRRLVIVAVELEAPPERTRDRILAHAAAGAVVIVNGTWWRNTSLKQVRAEPDRVFYTLGRGQVIAYKQAIADPSEFALDVIDAATHKRRAVRLWNAPAVVALATVKGALIAINYGSPAKAEIQARIQGAWAKATLLRPEKPPLPLKTARRGATTEVMVPELRRLGVVVFG